MSARDAARALFADVLDYPGPGFRASVEGGVAQFTAIDAIITPPTRRAVAAREGG